MRQALAAGTMTIRPIRTMMNHATTEIFLDGVEVPGGRARRRGGQGLPLHPRRHERRADPDRRRVHRRRPLVRREGSGATRPSASSSAGRSARTRASSSRSPARTRRSRRPTSMRYKAAWLFERGEPCGAEANMAKLLASEASWAGGERLPRHARRLRLRRGVRRRAEVPRDAALPIAPVSNNLVLAYLGQHVLGMPRSY